MKRTRKANHGKFIQCPDEFIALGFSPMDCRIIGTILSLSKKKGYCYASTNKIAHIVNTSVRAVQKYLKKLIEQGVAIKKIVIDECGDSKRQLIINNDIISKITNKDTFAINEQMFVESEQKFVKNEQKFVGNEQKFADFTPQEPYNHSVSEPKSTPENTLENKREQQSTETNPPQAQNSTSTTQGQNAAAAFSDDNELINRLRAMGVSESKASWLVKKVSDDNDKLTASMLIE